MKTSKPSESRRGWGIVIGLAVVLCICFGATLNVLSVFTPPIQQAFHCSNEEAARVATVFLLTMTLAMPAAGCLLDRMAPRPVMIGGAALTVLGYLAAAHSADISQLTAALGVAGVGVGASTYVPAITLASRWIAPDRQGLAFGILLAGAALGAIIFPLPVTYVTQQLGWRYAMQVIAAVIALTCIPILLWIARAPDSRLVAPHGEPVTMPLHGHEIGEALCMPRYWLWIVMLMLITLSSLGVYIALVPYLLSAGYSAERAAAIYMAIGAATLVGNFLFGALSNRWGAKTVLLMGTALSAIGILCLLAVHHRALGMIAIALFSLIWGSTFNLANQLSPLLLAESMGQRNFGSLLGIGNLISGVGSAFSPEALGYLVDATHTYTIALMICAGLMVAALVPISLLQRAAPALETA
ncbi:MFS transporter (plasmid) [Cupriavidus necator]|uniref:MFS transporter n=1 Tax=Cupriavidus necator TaxID=106590 RepID=A0A367P8H0_CUPNE|nr:MFS transporter [Cupriavidus necator]QQX89155.1 MFS transporter [Cupriavidus necator]RCJ04130.1 MFS transporter [Cupriavidus necator]